MIPPDELIRLWSEHGAALELLARARCASPEDCVQTAFIRLAGRPELPDDPVAWLARVVRNCAIDQIRSDLRRRHREREFAEGFCEAFELPPLVAEYTPDEIARALIELDVESREVVTAHVWGGLTFRQIAEAFELSPSVAHRRYTTAIEQLRNILQSTDRVPTESLEK